MGEENIAGLDWNALLQKAEEEVMKCEEYVITDQPLTGIEELRGVEHAYYEAQKVLEEAESALGNTKVSPTKPQVVSRQESEEESEPHAMWQRGRVPSGQEHALERMGGPEALGAPEPELTPPTTNPKKGKGEEQTMYSCEKCGKAMNPVERMGGPICLDCARKAHRAVVEGKGEEAPPLDSKAVKDALKNALTDASDFIAGIEEFLADVDNLDMEKIDEAIELVSNIRQTLQDAREMGYLEPEGEPTGTPSGSQIHMPTPDEYSRALTSPSPEPKDTDKSEA